MRFATARRGAMIGRRRGGENEALRHSRSSAPQRIVPDLVCNERRSDVFDIDRSLRRLDRLCRFCGVGAHFVGRPESLIQVALSRSATTLWGITPVGSIVNTLRISRQKHLTFFDTITCNHEAPKKCIRQLTKNGDPRDMLNNYHLITYDKIRNWIEICCC